MGNQTLELIKLVILYSSIILLTINFVILIAYANKYMANYIFQTYHNTFFFLIYIHSSIRFINIFKDHVKK